MKISSTQYVVETSCKWTYFSCVLDCYLLHHKVDDGREIGEVSRGHAAQGHVQHLFKGRMMNMCAIAVSVLNS